MKVVHRAKAEDGRVRGAAACPVSREDRYVAACAYTHVRILSTLCFLFRKQTGPWLHSTRSLEDPRPPRAEMGKLWPVAGSGPLPVFSIKFYWHIAHGHLFPRYLQLLSSCRGGDEWL